VKEVTMSVEPPELHARDHEQFLEEVHSFEFWFEAVDGYLRDHPYGYSPGVPEPELEESDRDGLIATLATYCVGETAALEGASGMIGFAPNRQSQVFLATQVVDEARHLEVFVHRLRDLGVEDPEGCIESHCNRNLLAFKRRLLEFVDARDWEASVFAQNVILESMEFATFHSHMQQADPKTAQILEGVIKDERRHMGFGENDLGRRLATAPHVRKRLEHIKKELDVLVLAAFDESLDELKVPRSERPDLGKHYLEMVERLGFGR
jgi:ribonucleotide reductase beta subunit family protein with ferritin-like domain